MGLLECFTKFVEREQLSARDPWYCPKCAEHVQAFKKFDLWSLPEVLIVHLKRFSYETYGTSRFGPHVVRDKLTTLVDFPAHLSLAHFVIGPSVQPPEYELFAVSVRSAHSPLLPWPCHRPPTYPPPPAVVVHAQNHAGNMGGGHYTAYAKNFRTGQWFDFNDSSVSATSGRDLVSTRAYVLFYRRVPGDSRPPPAPAAAAAAADAAADATADEGVAAADASAPSAGAGSA